MADLRQKTRILHDQFRIASGRISSAPVLVENVDDMRASNPASNEELLSTVAQYLIDNQFDLKQLMRVILQSKSYARSSIPLPENRDETRILLALLSAPHDGGSAFRCHLPGN